MNELAENKDILELSMIELKPMLQEQGIWFKEDYSLKYFTYFKTGGTARYIVFPKNMSEIQTLISYFYDREIQYKLIGFTTNLLFLDGLKYSVIVSTQNLSDVKVGQGVVEVEAGYSLQDFVRLMVMHEVQGFEGLEGVPGSIGGGVFMNAGAYGDEIADNLISVKCLNKTGKLVVLSKLDCKFAYRNSVFKSRSDLVIVSASFKTAKGDIEKIEKNIETYHIARHSYQDFVYPSLGSMYSAKGDIYFRCFRDNNFFLLVYYMLKLVLKNPLSKFLMRKRPHNIIFNKLAKRKLGNFEHRLSKKSINILINDGNATDEKLVAHIKKIGECLGGDVAVENEIVLGPPLIKDKGFYRISEIVNKLQAGPSRRK